MSASQRTDYDLVVIGAGSGGIAASRRAAQHGARVLLCERDRVGGTCVMRGCVPKKLLVYGTHFADEVRDAQGYGWTIPEARLDWATLQARKRAELTRLEEVYRAKLLASGVELVHGAARLRSAQEIEVGGRRFRGRHLLIATGSHSLRPDTPGASLGLTSAEVLELDQVPDRVVVIGGGYIGAELASVLNTSGAEVSWLVRGPRILPSFDADLARYLEDEVTARGIDLRRDCQVTRMERPAPGGPTLVHLGDGRVLAAEAVILATGRGPSTADLGLEEVGVKLTERGAVHVDDFSASSVPGVHAVGDCTDRELLTPAAVVEGRALADTLFGGLPTPVAHRLVPSAVFSQPAVASVGLSEEEAAKSGAPLDIYQARFRPMKHILAGRSEQVLIKLVVDRHSRRVLGLQMGGLDCPEIVQTFAIALTLGARKEDLDRTLALHPTVAEELFTLRTPRRP